MSVMHMPSPPYQANKSESLEVEPMRMDIEEALQDSAGKPHMETTILESYRIGVRAGNMTFHC